MSKQSHNAKLARKFSGGAGLLAFWIFLLVYPLTYDIDGLGSFVFGAMAFLCVAGIILWAVSVIIDRSN